MKLARLANTPSALADFFQEGLEALGAVCERTWHDRIHLVAEGPAARLWKPDGALLETEIHFVPPEETGARKADAEVFPGCPLTFRLAEELRPRPLPLERAVVANLDNAKPPAPEVAEKLWHAQMPGASRWRMEGVPAPDWHFSLLALARCEIQAIDQHWSLHRVAVSLADGHADDALASGLDFLQAASPTPDLQWPALPPNLWQDWLKRALGAELQTELAEIRERQQRYLGRELGRVDAYFEQYQKELEQRSHRSHADSTRLKAEQRLAAAKNEHERRRQDQIHRHEIRAMTHVDALIVLAEPAWRTRVSFTDRGERGENQTRSALFVPRARRWTV